MIKSDVIDLRIEPNDKQLLVRAAALNNLGLSEFIRVAARQAAIETLQIVNQPLFPFPLPGGLDE